MRPAETGTVTCRCVLVLVCYIFICLCLFILRAMMKLLLIMGKPAPPSTQTLKKKNLKVSDATLPTHGTFSCIAIFSLGPSGF